jgi:uncharacterized membrane protein YhaH (DUF805 family)
MNEYITVWKKFADFSGRARRREYWMFVLFNIIVSVVLGVVDGVLGLTTDSGQGIIGGIYSLAVLVPTIAVGVRRMHDTGRAGWWLIVPIMNLIYTFTDSQPGTNEYGPNPKESAA